MQARARGCSGRVSIAGRVAGHAGRGRGPSGAGGGGARAALSPPRGRVRAVVARPALRRTGVCPRAPAGGGEPRAARPRLDAARSRSAPAPPPRAPEPRRRARSLAARALHARPPAPRLRPVFLWARQRDGTVQEVRCEDYDPRNRIRIARTADGWRVIPRTEIYNSIRVPPAAPRERKERRRRRRPARSRRRRAEPATEPAWLAPDLESHIPSHTIAVPRAVPATAEPTPLDNLLAVAELEFNQQRGEEALELELQATVGPSAPAAYPYLPAEEVARDVMSFELAEPKPPDGIYYDRKTTTTCSEEPYGPDIGSHKDLFETINEAHYLPELGGPHDEALLESLVEKGCEDNQILGQALDKFAHLVHGTGEYVEEEEDILLSGAPVADIIDRLEQTLESPSRSSMTAAQGLLHLHHIGDHLSPAEHQHAVEGAYMTNEVFASDASNHCSLEALSMASELQQTNEVNNLEYDENAVKRLQNDVEPNNMMYTQKVPDLHKNYEPESYEEQESRSRPHLNEALPDENEENVNAVCKGEDVKSEEISACDMQTTNTSENDHLDMDLNKNMEEIPNSEELVPTDLSVKQIDKDVSHTVALDNTHTMEDSLSDKSDEQPKDLSLHRRLPTPHASPRRMEIPRAPSRESDAMQSPQPSGIPAVPSSPEIFTMPLTKSKQALFLETLLSSPSPKMYTSEVTITKQQCEPLNLGKHRKSASPTVSSCSDEIRKINKEFGEPQEKKIKRESAEELAKISKVFSKCTENISDTKQKSDKPTSKMNEETSPLKQLQVLKSSPDFNIPDPLLIPKEKLSLILSAPAREIPALLIQRPELRLPQAFAFPAVLQDPDIMVVSLSQLEYVLENDQKKQMSPKIKETKSAAKTSPNVEQTTTPQPDQTSQPKPIPSMDALAGDIDAATSAALNQMLWLPYLSQLEAMAACSQNMDFLKALNSSGYTGSNYPDLSQMFNPTTRFMGPTGFPMMPPMDYDNRLQFAMWQEAMNNANAAQRSKTTPVDAQMKEIPSKSSDVQNPYVHSTKNYQNKPHSSARTSPVAHNYNNQRSMSHSQFMQNMYPGMNPNLRGTAPLPGLQIPYFNPNLMSQRSPRTGQQKSPTSPYYPNNNYLHSAKHSDGHSQRSSSTGSQESPRPRISVKSLHNLLEPTAAVSGAGSTSRRPSNAPASMGRRREEPEVGSTTPLGEPQAHLPAHMPPIPHDSPFHLWHPLFGK